MFDQIDSAVIVASADHWRPEGPARRAADALDVHIPVLRTTLCPEGTSPPEGVSALRSWDDSQELMKLIVGQRCIQPLLLFFDPEAWVLAAEVYGVRKVLLLRPGQDPGAMMGRVDVIESLSPEEVPPNVWPSWLQNLPHKVQSSTRASPERPYNVAVFYDPRSAHVNAIHEHLEAFRLHSRHHWFFHDGTAQALCHVPLSWFDAVVHHYSVRLIGDEFVSPAYAKALSEYAGFKVLFIQDEYDVTRKARSWIEKLGFHVVFSAAPEASIPLLYPPSRYPRVRFLSTLTGFVPERLETASTFARPLVERDVVIGYRGRTLGYWYGELGQEKVDIGKKMREACNTRGIPVDIDWTEESRIYGDDWYAFLGRCRATLGTESGSSIVDWDRSLRERMTKSLSENPNYSFEDAQEILAEHEGLVRSHVISPKMFEAIALRTALVLYEGEYSGVLEPHRHYIPLRKDFGNLDEVLAKLSRLDELEAMTERAHTDIVASGRYGYEAFVDRVDAILEDALGQGQGSELVMTLVGRHRAGSGLELLGERLNLVINKDMIHGWPLSQAEATTHTPNRAWIPAGFARGNPTRDLIEKSVPKPLLEAVRPAARVAVRTVRRNRTALLKKLRELT